MPHPFAPDTESTVAVFFGKGPADGPLMSESDSGVRIRVAQTPKELTGALPEADALLCWEPAAAVVAEALSLAPRLRWLQWPFIGVDSVLPHLKDRPDLILTNASGVFDEPIAEYVLTLVLAMAKDLPATLAMQRRSRWAFRETETISERKALIVGVGGVGRAIGRLLRAVGLEVSGVGRTARSGDAVFSEISAVNALPAVLPAFDYIIAAAPLTPDTRGLFSAQAFSRMRPSARFINVGRGELVDEQALVQALDAGQLAGAALDVFRQEPLPPESSLWRHDRVIVSPHIAGDVIDTSHRLALLFQDNLARFARGLPLRNRVDPKLGFVVRRPMDHQDGAAETSQ